jgi:SAM-dependent methyltransferase
MSDEVIEDGVRETGAAAPPFPGGGVEVAAGRADFSRREFALRELMDEPCTFTEYSAASRDLAQVNRWTRGLRPTLDFLSRVVEKTGVGHEPLHVVDVGCASGDTLRGIARWAAARSLPLRLTGVDMNPYAARLARICDREEGVAAGTIRWVTADAFAVPLERPAHAVICSLFTHHLRDEAVVEFLRWSERTARTGWFVNDLERTERAAVWFGRWAWAMRWHRFVQLDGPVSFRRAFVKGDWERMLGEAGLSGAGSRELRVFGVRPGRVCVERLRL